MRLCLLRGTLKGLFRAVLLGFRPAGFNFHAGDVTDVSLDVLKPVVVIVFVMRTSICFTSKVGSADDRFRYIHRFYG